MLARLDFFPLCSSDASSSLSSSDLLVPSINHHTRFSPPQIRRIYTKYFCLIACSFLLYAQYCSCLCCGVSDRAKFFSLQIKKETRIVGGARITACCDTNPLAKSLSVPKMALS